MKHQRAIAISLIAFTQWMSVSLHAGQAGAANLTGAWAITADVAGTPTTPTVTLKQDGEKLTGHYSSPTLGEADLTGTVKGQDFTFTFTAAVQDMPIPVTYKGTIVSKDELKGTLDIGGGMATGTFTAKPKP